MAMLLEDMLDLVRQSFQARHLLVPAGATELELADLDIRMQREFNEPLPREYRELLASINGFVASPFTVAGAFRQPLRRLDGTPYGDVEIPDAVVHAREMVIDYGPELDGLIAVTYGPSLHGWDPRAHSWFRGYYDSGIARHYRNLNELIADLLYEGQIDTRRFMPKSFKFSTPDATGQVVFGTG